MTPEELMKRYAMEPHIENGAFVERHYAYDGPDRAASGSIYYYVSPGESTQFHRIDCDEYWCYVAGSPLEIWQVDDKGTVTVAHLGIEEGCDPLIYIPKGVTFAARHNGENGEGTFMACITVPRFCYEGFTMYTKEEILARCPETARFFE